MIRKLALLGIAAYVGRTLFKRAPATEVDPSVSPAIPAPRPTAPGASIATGSNHVPAGPDSPGDQSPAAQGAGPIGS